VDLLAGVRLSLRTRALLALLGVVSIATPPLALAGGRIPTALLALILAGSWLAFFLAVEGLVNRLVPRAVRAIEESLMDGGAGYEAEADILGDLQLPEEFVEPVDTAEEPGGEVEGEMDIADAALLAWGLASSVLGEIAGRRVRAFVAVHDEGLIYYVYPETYDDEVYQVADEDFDGDVAVAKAGSGSYLLVLSEDALEAIYRMATRGEGERLVAREPGEVRLLYKIAREVARAHLAGAPQAYQDYVAYKTIVKMAMRGHLEAPQSLLDEIPDVDTHTRAEIKRQVEEELHATPHEPGSPNPSQ
jgi:uncharacterized protein YjeT (DUF2065 family)